MVKRIILSTRDTKEASRIRTILREEAYAVNIAGSLESLTDLMNEEAAATAILDLDSIFMDNRVIRNLAKTHPEAGFLCMSEKRVHPDFKESICNYFYACLTKPVDFEELLYWLRCIGENSSGTSVKARGKQATNGHD